MLSKILEYSRFKKRVSKPSWLDTAGLVPILPIPHIDWKGKDEFFAIGFDTSDKALDIIRMDEDVADVSFVEVPGIRTNDKPVFKGTIHSRYSRGEWAMGPDMIARRIPR